MRIPPLVSLLGAAALLLQVLPCHGQLIILKNGQTAPAKDLHRDGDTLLTTIELAGNTGQQGYGIADIDRLDLPKPPQINQAEQALAIGKPADALRLIEPVTATFYPLRDIKGNYWAPAVLIKSSALEALGKNADATALLTLLAAGGSDKQASIVAKARLAGLLTLGGKAKAGEAAALADSIINSSDDHAVLAEAWLAKGHALMVQENYQDALLALLHLPVFYDENPRATAKAQLAAGRCYLAIGDKKRAARSFLQVEEDFGTLAEASQAKAEIAKGGPAMAAIVKELTQQEEQARNQTNGAVNIPGS